MPTSGHDSEVIDYHMGKAAADKQVKLFALDCQRAKTPDGLQNDQTDGLTRPGGYRGIE